MKKPPLRHLSDLTFDKVYRIFRINARFVLIGKLKHPIASRHDSYFIYERFPVIAGPYGELHAVYGWGRIANAKHKNLDINVYIASNVIVNNPQDVY